MKPNCMKHEAAWCSTFSGQKTSQTRELAGFELSLAKKQICSPTFLPAKQLDSNKYTRVHINLVFTGDSAESLVYGILQLDVLNKGPAHVSVGTIFDISQYIFIKETGRGLSKSFQQPCE
ncbi:hypothetical protein T265_04105 [Opisthorchis viverrini]|uniref:Uncharacterized protein n=1 Tax=Opisthorchis viverrini TaxID=6198 RepID=A0A074ZTX2_OPIVI|nr:hypothetical protein T265_04105 [Opisthorchis viverrini]KER29262.1 hypothetical protein T265_04105 [Opisthorchis viverrini]